MVSSNPGIAADKVFREEATLIRSTVYFSQILQYTENSKKLNQRVLEEVDKIIQAEKDANFVSNYSWIYRIEIMLIKNPNVCIQFIDHIFMFLCSRSKCKHHWG